MSSIDGMTSRGAGAVRRSGKHLLLLGLDVTAALAALAGAAAITTGDPAALFAGFKMTAPTMALSAAVIFYFAGLSRRFWRFFSIVDLAVMLVAAALLSAFGHVFFNYGVKLVGLPMGLFVAHWLLTVTLMSFLRMARRLAPQVARTMRAMNAPAPDADAPPALIVGAPDCVELLLRQRAAGLAEGFRPVGVLVETDADYRRTVRGVPILGGFAALNQVVNSFGDSEDAPTMLVVAASRQSVSDPKYVALASTAETAGLKTVRASMAGAVADAKVDLREFDMSELLGRPPAKLDADLIARAIEGRRVLVTGAGGSIGGELVRQIASFKPASLVLVELGEYNLYKIEHELSANFPDISVEPILCDICDRDAIMRIFADAKPELVFHAAALKHVPLVERNPCAGAATNVLGTKGAGEAGTVGAPPVIASAIADALAPLGIDHIDMPATPAAIWEAIRASRD